MRYPRGTLEDGEGGRIGMDEAVGSEADDRCLGGRLRGVLPSAKKYWSTYVSGSWTASLIAFLSNSINTLAVSAPSPRI